MNPGHWLEAAEQLLGETRRGAPRQVNLRCAVSMIYYALFHWLANSAADALAGSSGPGNRSWVRVYRGLDHRQVRQQCRLGRIPKDLPSSIRRFAAEIAEMQGLRHEADYDPSASFSKSDVREYLGIASNVLEAVQVATPAEKRALAIHVLFKERPAAP